MTILAPARLLLAAVLTLTALASSPLSAQIEVLVYSTQPAPTAVTEALENLTLDFRLVTDEAAFNASLVDKTEWILVVIDNPDTVFDSTLLRAYLAADGRAVINYAGLDLDLDLMIALGITSGSNLTQNLPIEIIDPAQPIWTWVSDIVGPVAVGAGVVVPDYGSILQGGPDVTVAGAFDPVDTAQGAVLVDSNNNFVVVGQSFLALDSAQAIQLAENGIGLVLARGGCVPVDIFGCSHDCATGDVTISYKLYPGLPPTSINIWWNATLLASLTPCTPSPTCIGSYTHSPGPGPGVHSYTVEAICPFGPPQVVRCRVVIKPKNYVYKAEASTGAIDSVAALTEAFDALGESYVVRDNLIGDPCGFRPGQNIFVMMGTAPDHGTLTIDQGNILAQHVMNGGSVYIEGSNVWSDPPTPFADVDGVENGPPLIGGELIGLIGVDYLCAKFAGMDSSYTSEGISIPGQVQDFISPDPELPGSAAGAIWIDPIDPSGSTGIFHDTGPGIGNVVAQVWEFGGYDGDQEELLRRYLEALNLDPRFVRGDTNGDGVHDIGDIIALLDWMFADDAEPSCLDAADANDDGSVNIGDAIAGLNALFVAGVSLPAPFPTCGPDPSEDGLSCTTDCCP